MIKKCTQKALNHLTYFLSGEIDSYELKTRLFGSVCSNLSPIANMRDNNYNNRRLAWEDIRAPPIERDAVLEQSKVDKKRKLISSKGSNAKRGRYDVPPADWKPPPVFDDRYHQRPGFGFHFTGYEQRSPQIQYAIPGPYLSPTSANLSVPRRGYDQNLINPSGPGSMRTSHQFSHGPDILRSPNFSHRYHQPDPAYRYGRGFR